MGYLDPSILSSSIDSAKCRVPAYAMAYINAMENGVDCDGPYNKLRSMIYMIKILECVQPEPPAPGPVIPPPSPCPEPEPCPDPELGGARAYLNEESVFVDPTNCSYTIIKFNTSGSAFGSSSALNQDLTDPLEAGAFRDAIISAMDSTYGITSSGTVSSNGSNISINVYGTGSIPIPTPTVTICIFDSSSAFAIPIILS